jgi:uncharacterized protein (TIGR03435 family)
MNKMIMIVIGMISHFGIVAQAQEIQHVYPEVGKPMPDFVLRNIEYYPKKQASLADFKGKWLILDFWNKGCGSCVKSFPKVNGQMKEFGDRVQFMLVGYQDREKEIKPRFARLRDKMGLELPCAFDSSLCQLFDVYAAPFIIVIDDKGIVRGITMNVSSQNISDFLQGKNPLLYPSNYGPPGRLSEKVPFDNSKPFLVNGNGAADSEFVFRSVLSGWDPRKYKMAYPPERDGWNDKNIKDGRLQMLGVSLGQLYSVAYLGTWRQLTGYIGDTSYGKYYDQVVLKLKDTSLFTEDWRSGKNCYSYSQIMPADRYSKTKMLKTMQQDLKNYFGYEAKVEAMPCPYFKLVATDKAKIKLKTKGEPQSGEGEPYFSWIAKNVPVTMLLQQITAHIDQPPIILDETGIGGNIDITLHCFFKDLHEIKKALQENGLDLIPSTKPMNVLVITDGDY